MLHQKLSGKLPTFKKRYPYVQGWIDHRTGRPRFRFRRRGFPRVELPEQIGSPEFVLAHAAALNAPPAAPVSALRGGVERSGAQPLIGVYLLMLRGKVAYIGSSLNMPRRVAEHRANGRPFDKAFYIATEAREREALERLLIRTIKPQGNRNWVNDDET